MAKGANKGKDKDLTDEGGWQMASIRKQRAAYYCLGGKQSSLSTFLITILSPNTLRVDKKGGGEGDEVEDESKDEGGDTK